VAVDVLLDVLHLDAGEPAAAQRGVDVRAVEPRHGRAAPRLTAGLPDDRVHAPVTVEGVVPRGADARAGSSWASGAISASRKELNRRVHARTR